MKKLHSYLLPVLWLLFAIAVPRANAQPGLEKLRVTYSAISGSQASVWIPYEAGIFRKHGLDVELLYVGGGGRAAVAKLAPEQFIDNRFFQELDKEGFIQRLWK